MNTTNTTLTALLMTTLLVVPGFALAATPLVVEMRLEKITALQPFAGTAIFTWGNNTTSVPIAATTGQAISLSQQFRNAPTDAPQSIVITDTMGLPLVNISTIIENGNLRPIEAWANTARLSLSANDSSYRVVTGTVTGDFNASVTFRGTANAASSIASVAVDLNGDGVLDVSEVTPLGVSGAIASASIHMVNVPATSAWNLSVTQNGTTIVALQGQYDWLNGLFVGLNPDAGAGDEKIASVLQSVAVVPNREAISGIQELQNTLILKESVKTDSVGQRPKTGLILSWGDPEPQGPSESVAPHRDPGPAVVAPAAVPPSTDVEKEQVRLWLPVIIGVVALAVTSVGVGLALARKSRKEVIRGIAHNR